MYIYILIIDLLDIVGDNIVRLNGNIKIHVFVHILNIIWKVYKYYVLVLLQNVVVYLVMEIIIYIEICKINCLVYIKDKLYEYNNILFYFSCYSFKKQTLQTIRVDGVINHIQHIN